MSDIPVTAQEDEAFAELAARVGLETEAYATYLNARHVEFDDPDEQRCFDEDLVKARAAMETAWLKAKPVKP